MYGLPVNHLIWWSKLRDIVGGQTVLSGEERRETIRPGSSCSTLKDFQATKITSDACFLLLRETDGRFGVSLPMGDEPEDTRSRLLTQLSQPQKALRGLRQIAAGMKTNHAASLRIDPVLRLAIGKYRGGQAFADYEVYEYCEGERLTQRHVLHPPGLSANSVPKGVIHPDPTRRVARLRKAGIQIRLVDMGYQPRDADREPGVVAKIG